MTSSLSTRKIDKYPTAIATEDVWPQPVRDTEPTRRMDGTHKRLIFSAITSLIVGVPAAVSQNSEPHNAPAKAAQPSYNCEIPLSAEGILATKAKLGDVRGHKVTLIDPETKQPKPVGSEYLQAGNLLVGDIKPATCEAAGGIPSARPE